MRSPQLIKFARRMQRVRKQKQSSDELRLLRRQHAALSSTVGMTSEEDAPRSFGSQQVHGTAQAFTIARSHGWERWPARTRLAKGQIAAQHKISGIRESIGQSNQ